MPQEKPCYTTIRVRAETRARLAREISLLLSAHENGCPLPIEINPETINPLSPGISIDAVINLLLDQRESKRKRSRKSKRKGR